MADVSIKYKNQEIASLSASGTKKAKTAGKYCEDDITIEYTKPTVTFNTHSKSVTPTESAQDVTPDSGYDGLNKVSVRAIPSNYVGSAIARRDATSLTANGATVSVPGGYYSGNVSKNVATATQATPSINVSSTGLITASATQTAGYVSAGTKSSTQQLTTQSAKTVTPTKSEQTAVSSGVYTAGAIKVGPIPSNYIDTSDATATEQDIVIGKTAYVNGVKVTGIKEESGNKYLMKIEDIESTYVDKTISTFDITAFYTDYANLTKENIIVELVHVSTSSTGLLSGYNSEITYSYNSSNGIITLNTDSQTAAFGGKSYGGLRANIYLYNLDNEPILVASPIEYYEFSPSLAFSNGLAVTGYPDQNIILGPSSMLYTKIDGSELGTAVASNVVSGQTFTSAAGLKVAGTLVVNKYYTGSTDPSSSLGNNGDLYLKVG